MDVESNPFCAGGMSLGNGSWAVFGGNQPVTTGESERDSSVSIGKKWEDDADGVLFCRRCCDRRGGSL